MTMVPPMFMQNELTTEPQTEQATVESELIRCVALCTKDKCSCRYRCSIDHQVLLCHSPTLCLLLQIHGLALHGATDNPFIRVDWYHTIANRTGIQSALWSEGQGFTYPDPSQLPEALFVMMQTLQAKIPAVIASNFAKANQVLHHAMLFNSYDMRTPQMLSLDPTKFDPVPELQSPFPLVAGMNIETWASLTERLRGHLNPRL